ncbi:MAG: SURF1 family cytochrome oxidase biogenesis protein [Pseudomonadota bacterium]
MSEAVASKGRPLWVKVTLLGLAVALIVTLIELGNWQLRRLAWKEALIEAVDARAFGTPVDPPVGTVTADDHAYLRVTLDGHFRHDLTQRVKALTELGAGHWIMVPLDTGDGIVWINRGFAPAGLKGAELTKRTGRVSVQGLLRISEPGGTRMEKNDPAAGRWVSRDVAALTSSAGFETSVAFFVDADHAAAPHSWPRGGLTRIDFHNSHLSYALTWYAMAFLLGLGVVIALRENARNTSPIQVQKAHMR